MSSPHPSSLSYPPPPQRHDVIALVSGGKDSFLALLHCLFLNYRVVALANLFPPPDRHTTASSNSHPTEPIGLPVNPPSDLNSHMYQTAGHALIPLYATALQIPVYRHPIHGSALNSRREYFPPPPHSSPQTSDERTTMVVAKAEAEAYENAREKAGGEEEDETESLIPLLRHIKALHPTSTALCSGAIFSTYQRTRLESVALRVNLQPLAPLWQYPCLRILRPHSTSIPAPCSSGEVNMLRDIVAVGLEARIVKVASGGLDAGILWEDLRDEGTRERVRKGVGRFGGSVVGEGGEFETLVLDGPGEVWKGGRIEVEPGQRSVFGGEGGEAWMGFEGGKVAERKVRDDGEGGWKKRLAIPGLWDLGFETLVERIEKIMEEGRMNMNGYIVCPLRQDWIARETIHETNCTLYLSNLTAAADANPSAAAQMAAVGAHFRALLQPYKLATTTTLFTTLLLRSMADFPSVNAVYSTFFPSPLPPARVTVACGDALPAGTHVMASFAVGRRGGLDDRQGLHVQSRSYWAPANIGPYSQAVEMRARRDAGAGAGASKCAGATLDAGAGTCEPALVFVSGQIPLVPMTMEPLGGKEDESRFSQQVCLALQHLWRIGRERGVGWWMGGVAYLVSGNGEGRNRAQAAWLAWRMIHEREFENENEPAKEEEEEWDVWDRSCGGKGSFAVAENTTRLPDLERVTFECGNDAADNLIPGFFAVQVDELPRGCPIEWQALGVKSGHVTTQAWAADGKDIQSSAISACDMTVSYVAIPKLHSGQSLEEELFKAVDSLHGATAAKGGGHGEQTSLIAIYTSEANQVQKLDVQVIPCRAVWGRNGVELVAGVVIQSDTRE